MIKIFLSSYIIQTLLKKIYEKNILYIILGGILLTVALMQGCMKEKNPLLSFSYLPPGGCPHPTFHDHNSSPNFLF